jgi:hypothetical protein
MRPLALLVLIACLLFAPETVKADEYQLAGASAFGLVALGLFVVDVGVSVANGFAMSNGTSNKPNGYFSIGAAVASYGMVAAVYAWSDDDDSQQDQFALIMGTAGTAALVTGIMVIRRAGARSGDSESLSGVHMSPTVIKTGGGGPAAGVRFTVDF